MGTVSPAFGLPLGVKGLGGLLGGGGSVGAGKGGGEKLGTAGSCDLFPAVPDGFGSDAFGDDAFGSDPKNSPADAVADVSDALASEGPVVLERSGAAPALSCSTGLKEGTQLGGG